MMKKLLMVLVTLSGLISLTANADVALANNTSIDPNVLSGALSELEAINAIPQDEAHYAEINQKYERFIERLRDGGATQVEIATVLKDMGLGYATIGTPTDTATSDTSATVTTVKGDTGDTGVQI